MDFCVSEAAESIQGLHLAADPTVRYKEYEIGTQWFDRVRTAMSPELMELLTPFSSLPRSYSAWCLLMTLVAEAPVDMHGFLGYLEAMPAEEVWLQLLGFNLRHQPGPALREAMLGAGRGRLDPLVHLLEGEDRTSLKWVPPLVTVFGASAARAKAMVLAAVDRWHTDVFSKQWPEIAPALARDIEDKRRLAGEHSLSEVVEEATNGGEYVPEVGIDRLLLIPSYLSRPWVNHDRHRNTLVMQYPVGEDALAPSVEEARRRRILRIAKVLADESRLRALRRLAESPWTLQELADDLDLGKSTMHHHLAALRAAGLLRVRLHDKRYSLRIGPLSEVSGLLGDYLGSTKTRSSHGRRR
ncbi:MAG TPA: winged helix-turn-helix domain-containing protein [Candidatus Dormibacteraeota bacterium]|nr:winged helix-turn-helix domain-containing protein [Candidatus Dormibacteraeota bacterium]